MTEKIRGVEDFAKQFDVSRESLERLKIYEELLVKWQKIQNIVAASTLDEIWHRHFADSAQLISFIENPKTILDLGSGGGFPGMVVAIMLAEREELTIHLVEANGRKCGFLREVVRQTGLSRMSRAGGGCGISVEIHNARIEEFAESHHAFEADLILARALAPLTTLLALAQPFFSTNSKALFLKGQDVESEIGEAREGHAFQYQIHNSLTDPGGRILRVSLTGHMTRR